MTTAEQMPAFAAIAKRFESGNAIPVERAMVLASEWHELEAEVRAYAAQEVAPLLHALELIAAQHTGNPVSTKLSDCMAVIAKNAIRARHA